MYSWSKKYYRGLPDWQHKENDAWFKKMLSMLKDTGVLVVPNLNKSFSKSGDEIIQKEIILTETEMNILKKHYYGNRAFTTDEMSDLWHGIVEQILKKE